MSDITVRPAEPSDAPALGKLAGELVRQHHRADPDRFLLVENVEQGYERWLQREMARKGAVVLVAERAGVVVGYSYGTIEGRDWNMLLDEHGAIHDILVDEGARRSGAGEALLAEMLRRLEAQGARRVVLSTMVNNQAAQRLFAAAGFRPTMLEMTRSRG